MDVQVWWKSLPFPNMCPKVRSLSGIRTSCSLVFKSSLIPRLSTRGSTTSQMNTFTGVSSLAIIVFVLVTAICTPFTHTRVFCELHALPVEGSCCSERHHRFHTWWLECRSAYKTSILLIYQNILWVLKTPNVCWSEHTAVFSHNKSDSSLPKLRFFASAVNQDY